MVRFQYYVNSSFSTFSNIYYYYADIDENRCVEQKKKKDKNKRQQQKITTKGRCNLYETFLHNNIIQQSYVC